MDGGDLLISCEHATNHIPRRYAAAFAGARRELASHAGWDRGALAAARQIARACRAPLHAGGVSRLLIDLNRSPGHRGLYSRRSVRLPPAERVRIYNQYYAGYRQPIEQAVLAGTERGPLIQLSVHSFAARLGGRTRQADIGLLYDPRRSGERAAALAWQAAILVRDPSLRVRRNYPYRGIADGFVQSLRRRWPAASYVGLELEINQALTRPGPSWTRLQRLLAVTFTEVVRQWRQAR